MISLKKILLPGIKLEVKIIDVNDPSIKKSIAECQKQQQKILDSKKIEYLRLENVYITI